MEQSIVTTHLLKSQDWYTYKDIRDNRDLPAAKPRGRLSQQAENSTKFSISSPSAKPMIGLINKLKK